MKYVWGTGTHVGRVRDGNEDSLYPDVSGASGGPLVLMVADGMGGAAAGEIASSVAVAAASEQSADSMISSTARVTAANEAVGAAAAQDSDLSGMGTTLTLVRLTDEGTMEVGHVGDSRGYLLRSGELRQFTTDHTLVNELVELGRITSEAATTHPHRHLLTRTLGLGPVAVDSDTLELQDGDRVLLCSDGLTDMVSDFGIEQILKAGNSVDATAWSLIEHANSAGGVDNTTVVLIDATA